LKATASVVFDVNSPDEANTIVHAWDLPEGAAVSVTITDVSLSGTVSDGTIVPPPTTPQMVES
jgi:hypothetical protein